jgi:hypothetical protein
MNSAAVRASVALEGSWVSEILDELTDVSCLAG